MQLRVTSVQYQMYIFFKIKLSINQSTVFVKRTLHQVSQAHLECKQINQNRKIFSFEEKFAAEILQLRIDCGRLFHTRGLDTQKPRPPALDERVRGSITFP